MHIQNEALMKYLFNIGVLLCGISTLAQAAPAPAYGGVRETSQMPCSNQYVKFCSAVPTGEGRKLLCMIQHLPELTSACRERTKAVYQLESELAAKNHMTVPQYIKWGMEIHERAKAARTSLPIETGKPRQTPSVSPQPGSPQPGSKSK